MRAVIIATGQSANPLWNDKVPVPLLPLVDRPFIQHVVEYCVGQGVRVFDWILCHLPEEIEQFLGSGDRWGAEFRYHLVRDPFRPYATLHQVVRDTQTNGILLGHADRLPAWSLAEAGADLSSAGSVLFGWNKKSPNKQERWKWTGWAAFSRESWRGLRGANLDEAGLYQMLSAANHAPLLRQEVPPPLSVQSFGDILESNRAVLHGEFPGLLLPGMTAEPNLRRARCSVIHPTAQLISPVYIGAGCEVAAGARVGPNVVLGRDCLIDRNTTVANAVILPGTYVAEGLELNEVVVDRVQIIPAHIGRWIKPREQHAVGGLTEYGLARRGRTLVSMLLGLILRVWRGGKVLHLREVLRLPAGQDEATWSTFGLWSFSSPHEAEECGVSRKAGLKHLLLDFLPALVNVARGDMRLVGLPARSPHQVKRLGTDWQALYLRGKVGIVSETLLNGGGPTREEVFATEGIYVMTGGFVRDLRLFLLYLLRMPWQPRRGLAANGAGQDKEAMLGDGAIATSHGTGTWRDQAPFNLSQSRRHLVPEDPERVPALTSSEPGPVPRDGGPAGY
jgi:hypothetical protein